MIRSPIARPAGHYDGSNPRLARAVARSDRPQRGESSRPNRYRQQDAHLVLPTDAAFPRADLAHPLLNIFAARLLDFFTALAIVGGLFLCFFCSF